MAEFILTTGTLDTNDLKCVCECLDEGVKKRRTGDIVRGWNKKRLRGDTQSVGTDEVKVAQKRRIIQRYATNLYWRHKLPGWNTGAEGTDSLVGSTSGVPMPLSELPGVCCGEVHGDRIHGR